MSAFIHMAERGLLPDSLLFYGVRRLSAERLKVNKLKSLEEQCADKMKLVKELIASPIAVHADKANEQHYELPPAYFMAVLGKRLKYSGCYFPQGVDTLDEAEEKALQLAAGRAQLRDGMDVLELGCGWGSFSLWMAESFPKSKIFSVSNSNSQREFIEARCQERNLANLAVHTEDINSFQTERRFDCVVSIEMFEHLRNYRELFSRISGWLKDDGKLFTHVFSHKDYPYYFEANGSKNWMGKYFFTGGIMPSDDLFHFFQEDLILEDQWRQCGAHYQKTALAWLKNHDRNREPILKIFADTYGEKEKCIWFNRWRMFYIACAEVFGYKNGQEWGVSHYRFKKRPK